MENTLFQILVVEDNTDDYLLVHEYLQESFNKPVIYHANTLCKGIELLGSQNIDVILLDLTLPDSLNAGSFQLINEKKPGIPVIILTGLSDTDAAIESLKIGAQDYIVKDDCNPTLLQKSIKYGIERSKSFEHLKKSEEQYKLLFHSNPLPMFAYCIKSFTILMVNPAAVKHYGYAEQEFLQMSINSLKQPAEAVLPDNPTFLREESITATSEDLRHYKKNGELIYVEMAKHPIVIEGGDACMVVINDVTERNRAKELLRESELMFRTISENLPNGAVAIINKDLTVLYMAGKDLPKQVVSASYLENKNYTSLFDLTEKEKIIENLENVFNGNNTVFEVKDDGLSYMISAVPLFEAAGASNKVLLASQNISAQKKNETEKEMLIEELMQNNSDLRQFSYITSHNLRAPLSNLLGILKLLDTSSVSDPTTVMLLKNFEECTYQLNDTVNDLINVLIIKNNVNAKKEKLDIRKIFERVVSSVQNNLEQNHMIINADFDRAYEVEFNRSYLESILLNLLTNSVKYQSPKRTPEIKIRAEKTSYGIILYFTDNGLGIDLNRYKDRIFGLYQRFHNHADSKGLGLYIVNSQVRVMGGEIDVESEVDKGTTFIIRFKN